MHLKASQKISKPYTLKLPEPYLYFMKQIVKVKAKNGLGNKPKSFNMYMGRCCSPLTVKPTT